MRLQKFLSAAGLCSRRKGEGHIRAGRVKVNGVVVTRLGTQVDPRSDRVEFDGQPVVLNDTHLYIALHKPKGVVTSCRQEGQTTVVDLLDLSRRVYPVGRLDRDSTGLLLLTDDGGLHHRLLHPSFDHEKEYEVRVARPIADGALKRIERGMPIMGSKTRPAAVRRLSPSRFRIVLREGRNRQIRRMVRKVGHRVVRLQRIRVVNIRLGDLPVGRWRHLRPDEVRRLLAAVRRSPAAPKAGADAPKAGRG
jgi:23S rRNA pseudouridine2605 synthase/23S rRNA pseudouridine2604 synthase